MGVEMGSTGDDIGDEKLLLMPEGKCEETPDDDPVGDYSRCFMICLSIMALLAVVQLSIWDLVDPGSAPCPSSADKTILGHGKNGVALPAFANEPCLDCENTVKRVLLIQGSATLMFAVIWISVTLGRKCCGYELPVPDVFGWPPAIVSTTILTIITAVTIFIAYQMRDAGIMGSKSVDIMKCETAVLVGIVIGPITSLVPIVLTCLMVLKSMTKTALGCVASFVICCGSIVVLIVCIIVIVQYLPIFIYETESAYTKGMSEGVKVVKTAQSVASVASSVAKGVLQEATSS